MQKRYISIVGTGKYLPGEPVISKELDRKLNKPFGWVEKKSGIKQRYYAKTETTSQMGAKAALQAIENARLSLKVIDCIIFCGAGPEQAIPATSALIQRELGLGDSGIPCFDINMTCLGFLAALDISGHLVSTKQYATILIVASEIPSLSLNWEDPDTSTIFGDGAAAVLVTQSNKSSILSYKAATFAQAAHLCEYKGSGTRFHPRNDLKNILQNNQFRMDGRGLVKLIMKHSPTVLEETLKQAGVTRQELALCIPHQTSQLGMKLAPKLLSIPVEKIMNIYPDHGNQVAASIPITLHQAIAQKQIKRGDKLLLIGTAAGVSTAAMILEY